MKVLKFYAILQRTWQVNVNNSLIVLVLLTQQLGYGLNEFLHSYNSYALINRGSVLHGCGWVSKHQIQTHGNTTKYLYFLT